VKKERLTVRELIEIEKALASLSHPLWKVEQFTKKQ
jgi:hypothetical protein